MTQKIAFSMKPILKSLFSKLIFRFKGYFDKKSSWNICAEKLLCIIDNLIAIHNYGHH